MFKHLDNMHQPVTENHLKLLTKASSTVKLT